MGPRELRDRTRPVYEEFKPNSTWTEDDVSHVITIQLPEFTKEQLKITVSQSNIIQVSGERPSGLIDHRWIRFNENYEAPRNSDLNGIRARFASGILSINIPKKHSQESTDKQPQPEPEPGPQPQLADPDGGSSSLCTACTLPIFSTPSVSVSKNGDQLFLHQQCSDLPEELLHELHPDHTLVRLNLPIVSSTTTCENCNRICGTMLYQCSSCEFRLDLLCALPIKIVHRSHDHSLQAIRLRDSGASLTCNACETKHDPLPSPATISYLCNLCGFWIHSDCASLPNPIVHYEHHQHSLFLTYNLVTSSETKCVICSEVPKRRSGVYFCLSCPNVLVHTRCALKNPHTFKPVFIRDAQVSDLGRLPLPNDRTSLLPYLRDNVAAATGNDLHSHPLIFHEDDDHSRGSYLARVCNACAQLVSPPFFSCSQCPDFFLHSSCANLPTQIQHRAHENHPLSLSPKAPNSDFSAGFYCKCCDLPCNGFAYSCNDCDNFSMDVACAMITPAITHELHNNTHILFMFRKTNFYANEMCNFCCSSLSGICYECSICRNFKLHARCALLNTTVGHKFDKHPLQLTLTTTSLNKSRTVEEDLCEICEQFFRKDRCYYSCTECEQSFHVDCIPSVDRLSRIKLGSTLHIDAHDCPLTLTRRGHDGCGSISCGFCGQKFKDSDHDLAYECCKCFKSFHHNCVEKCVLNR